MTKATVKSYVSSGCVLLAYDWEEGKNHPDFLGFAIKRTPGYSQDRAPQFLFNKLDFVPSTQAAKPKPSNLAPIQKFNWWDGGIKTSDQNKTFEYEIIPVLGTGPDDLVLRTTDSAIAKVTIPAPLQGAIATYFNRAVVSSQSFLKEANKSLELQTQWLANGLQDAIPTILKDSDAFDCAIYHLSDNHWILPAFRKFSGKGSIIYFSKGDDTKSEAAIDSLHTTNRNISSHKRDKISKLMHDKFIVSYKGGSERAVLMGSTNFTPEAQTSQANLLHILHSKQLAGFYAKRAHLLATNPATKDTSPNAGWQTVTDIPGSQLRVFFLPEPGSGRTFLDTVTKAIQDAKSSVLFCMFTASDEKLMNAIFEKGDSPDHNIYGLLNSVDDPDKPTKSGKPKKLPAIAATIFHRSREKSDTLPYAAFGSDAPRGWLPELRTIDTTSFDISVKKPRAGEKKKIIPPVHVHHKFIVIDGDTPHPVIYSGSPNFSKASENSNDENVLEIKGNEALAQVYVAEFLRLYNHYRARAIWAREHSGKAKGRSSIDGDVLVLKRSRDLWVKGAYKPGTKEYLARTRGL
jgi:phosphatidylserine/phosphatidylglycerophosphate/cardiolipin synthase-like enzyme